MEIVFPAACDAYKSCLARTLSQKTNTSLQRNVVNGKKGKNIEQVQTIIVKNRPRRGCWRCFVVTRMCQDTRDNLVELELELEL